MSIRALNPLPDGGERLWVRIGKDTSRERDVSFFFWSYDMFEEFDDADEQCHRHGEAGEEGPTILDEEALGDVWATQLVTQADAAGNHRIGYTQEADALRKMAPAAKAMQELAGNRGPLSKLKPGTPLRPQILRIDSPMREIYRAAAEYLDARHCFVRHRLSPYLQAVVDVVDGLELTWLPAIEKVEFLPKPAAFEMHALLLEMERQLRERLRSGALTRFAAGARRKANKNYQSGKRLFEACSKCSSQILSIRMDLSFHPDSAMRMTPRTEDDRLWLARRLKNLIVQHRKAVKKRFKRGLLGWIYKVEFGESSGFHIHCWYLFNRHLHRLQRPLCEYIEDQWMAVTMGQGYAFRVKPAVNFQRAVGLLDLNQPTTQAGIHRILFYLTKGDELIALELGDGSKTFLRSRLPVPKRSGRPRTEVVADYVYSSRRGDVMPDSNACIPRGAGKRRLCISERIAPSSEC